MCIDCRKQYLEYYRQYMLVVNDLVEEGLRIGKCLWCCDGFIEGKTWEILSGFPHYIKDQESMRETVLRREGEKMAGAFSKNIYMTPLDKIIFKGMIKRGDITIFSMSVCKNPKCKNFIPKKHKKYCSLECNNEDQNVKKNNKEREDEEDF